MGEYDAADVRRTRWTLCEKRDLVGAMRNWILCVAMLLSCTPTKPKDEVVLPKVEPETVVVSWSVISRSAGRRQHPRRARGKSRAHHDDAVSRRYDDDRQPHGLPKKRTRSSSGSCGRWTAARFHRRPRIGPTRTRPSRSSRSTSVTPDAKLSDGIESGAKGEPESAGLHSRGFTAAVSCPTRRSTSLHPSRMLAPDVLEVFLRTLRQGVRPRSIRGKTTLPAVHA